MKNSYTYKEFIKKAKEDKVDIFLSCSSFEKRCFVIPKLAVNFNPKNRVVFFNKNEVDTIISNAMLLMEIDKENTQLVDLNSNDPINNYLTMIRLFDSMISKQTYKPNIVIDTTTFTHETLLVLLRILHLRKDNLGDIRICYVGASEYSTNMKNEGDKWLSKGVDEIRTIIGYPGYTDPTRKNHLLIMFGFEFDRTRKIINEYEFDMISLGFGDLPIQSNHMKINCERHKNLVAIHPEAREFKFSLIDPIQTKNQLLSYINDNKLMNMNTVIAPLNNKISTIGAGLAAITNENIQLAYAKASIYNTAGYSEPNEDIYFHKINFD